MVLLGAASLCVSRKLLARLDNQKAGLVAYMILLVISLLVSESAYGLIHYLHAQTQEIHNQHLLFTLRNMAISAIICALLLRYLYIQHQWTVHIQSEASARIQALQARIRPHFLFNSMNTIASLTRGQCSQAEQAVEDLSDLFRASLSDASEGITFSEEIDIARRYLRIEKLRLDKRLEVEWDIDEIPPDAIVPALMIQPLLENAIYHGIEPRNEGGVIHISAKRDGRHLSVSISNPLPEATTRHNHDGNQIAMDNIRQRLEVFYETPGHLDIQMDAVRYLVTLEFPYITERS
jgi:two-component system sensor histidine kinase AlgZ